LWNLLFLRENEIAEKEKETYPHEITVCQTKKNISNQSIKENVLHNELNDSKINLKSKTIESPTQNEIDTLQTNFSRK